MSVFWGVMTVVQRKHVLNEFIWTQNELMGGNILLIFWISSFNSLGIGVFQSCEERGHRKHNQNADCRIVLTTLGQFIMVKLSSVKRHRQSYADIGGILFF